MAIAADKKNMEKGSSRYFLLVVHGVDWLYSAFLGISVQGIIQHIQNSTVSIITYLGGASLQRPQKLSAYGHATGTNVTGTKESVAFQSKQNQMKNNIGQTCSWRAQFLCAEKLLRVDATRRLRLVMGRRFHPEL